MKYTKRVLEKAFNKPFNEIFAEFDETPMGIGAIAQAYKAVLNPDLVPPEYFGPKYNAQTPRVLPLPAAHERAPSEAVPSTTVAIKVLHPNVEKTINRDLKIMGFFARVLNAFPGMEWLSFPQEVDVFGSMMRSQLDLTTEAKNLDKFEENFKHRTVVSFPRPLNAYTSKRVLVEEYEDAVPLKAFLREGGGPFDYRIASLGLDAFLVRNLADFRTPHLSRFKYRKCYCWTTSYMQICIPVISWSNSTSQPPRLCYARFGHASSTKPSQIRLL